MRFQVNRTRADAVSCNDCREKELLVVSVVVAYESVVVSKMAVRVTPHYMFFV